MNIIVDIGGTHIRITYNNQYTHKEVHNARCFEDFKFIIEKHISIYNKIFLNNKIFYFSMSISFNQW